MSSHVYIHYPYCLYKCHYCDFNSHAYDKAQIPQTQYANGLLGEIHRRRRLWQAKGTDYLQSGRTLASVFFGGGTPSLMSPDDTAALIAELRRDFVFDDTTEITLESNPGTVDRGVFEAFRRAGVNRISIGVQSLNDKYLSTFGRIHSAKQAETAIEAALAAGFARVNADLIFGFPGQTLPEWESDLERILTFGLKHLSCYALTAEAGTQFTKDVGAGRLRETDPDLFFDMLRLTHDRLEAAGLPAYEISNFAAPGEESRHNLGYWRFQEYAGIGAGAYGQYFTSSSGDVRRTVNHKAPEHYIRTVMDEMEFMDVEKVPADVAMKEFVMMGLRLREGIRLEDFRSRFRKSFEDVFGAPMRRNIEAGLLTLEGGALRPTREGFFRNNAVVREFF